MTRRNWKDAYHHLREHVSSLTNAWDNEKRKSVPDYGRILGELEDVDEALFRADLIASREMSLSEAEVESDG